MMALHIPEENRSGPAHPHHGGGENVGVLQANRLGVGPTQCPPTTTLGLQPTLQKTPDLPYCPQITP